jgi:hypothetical protein
MFLFRNSLRNLPCGSYFLLSSINSGIFFFNTLIGGDGRWQRKSGDGVSCSGDVRLGDGDVRPTGIRRRAASGGAGMPRKARLFTSSSGSAARGFLKFRANIPPRWIKNAQQSRKRIEPEIVEALRSLIRMRKDRPRAQVAIKKANHEFKAALSRWETAYNKENFYRGIRILLELQRNGSSKL